MAFSLSWEWYCSTKIRPARTSRWYFSTKMCPPSCSRWYFSARICLARTSRWYFSTKIMLESCSSYILFCVIAVPTGCSIKALTTKIFQNFRSIRIFFLSRFLEYRINLIIVSLLIISKFSAWHWATIRQVLEQII